MLGAVWPAAHALALPAGIAVAALIAGTLLVRRRRARVPGLLAPLLHALGEGLGDAVLVVDARGRVVEANAAALRAAALPRDGILGRDVTVMGADVARLWASVARGHPVHGMIAIPFGAVPVRAYAVAARLASVPRLDVLLLRPEPAPARPRDTPPPPLPPLPLPRAPPPPDAGEARAAIGAVAASVKAPLTRAATAASYVRLLAPPLPARAAEALASLERELEDAGRRLGAIASSAERGRAPLHELDVGALVAELVGSFQPAPGVRLRASIRPALALADDRPLRAAVREALRAASAGAPGGAVIDVSVAAAGGGAVIEIAGDATARDDDGAAAIAHALVAPLGGRVEEEAAPGRGRSVRIVLRGVPTPTVEVAAPQV
jgi:hypothetical protein